VQARVAVVVVALVPVVAVAAVATEKAGAMDLERVLAPQRLDGPLPEPAAVEPAVERPSLRLVWMDPAGAAVGVDARARDEAEALLGRLGVRVSWRRGVPAEPVEPGEVVVVLLDRATADADGKPVLGATPVRFDGARFVWVHVPGVRVIVGLDPRRSEPAIDPWSSRVLALALGRVVAHELVHAVAPSVPHGTGLMSASFTGRQLTAASIDLEPEVGPAVRAALRADTPLPRPETGVLAAAVGEEGHPR
jgi:hypothetical protein